MDDADEDLDNPTPEQSLARAAAFTRRQSKRSALLPLPPGEVAALSSLGVALLPDARTRDAGAGGEGPKLGFAFLREGAGQGSQPSVASSSSRGGRSAKGVGGGKGGAEGGDDEGADAAEAAAEAEAESEEEDGEAAAARRLLEAEMASLGLPSTFGPPGMRVSPTQVRGAPSPPRASPFRGAGG